MTPILPNSQQKDNNFMIIRDFFKAKINTEYNFYKDIIFDIRLHNEYPESPLNKPRKYSIYLSEILDKFFKNYPKIQMKN